MRLAAPVSKVRPLAGAGAEVVQELLDHADNPLWDRLAPFVGVEHFPTLPGICIIHTDDDVLAPQTRHLQHEDVQFTGSHAWRPDADNPYGLPYDLHASYATHLQCHGIPEIPKGLGLGGLWFAGNPATFDAEEGALLSAIGIASRMDVGFALPWAGARGLKRPHAAMLRRHFLDTIMFPSTWTQPRA